MIILYWYTLIIIRNKEKNTSEYDQLKGLNQLIINEIQSQYFRIKLKIKQEKIINEIIPNKQI